MRRDVGGGIKLFRECRSAKSVVESTANGELRYEIVAAGELADRRAAEVAGALVASGDVDAQPLSRLEREVDIPCIVLAVVATRVRGCKTRIRLGSTVEIRGRDAGADPVGGASVLDA